MNMDAVLNKLYTMFIEKGEEKLENNKKNSISPSKVNADLLMQILYDNRDTEYGKKYGFKDIHSVDEFRKKVPFSNYDVYEPYINRMINKGETNLITSYKVIQYVDTSGSAGSQKKIPVTNETIKKHEDSFLSRTITLAKHYYKKHNGCRIPIGKCLNLIESDSILVDNNYTIGSITGLASERFRSIFSILMTSPEPILIPKHKMNMLYMKARFALEEPNIVFIQSTFITHIVELMNYIRTNWELLLDDIENGTLNKDVCDENARSVIMPYIKKHPERARELRKIFLEGFDKPIIPKIWKNMSWVSCIATGSFTEYIKQFKQYAGNNIPIDYLCYAASEGYFAECIEMNHPSFLLLTDSCFFEFLPVNSSEKCSETLLLEQLEEGKEYEIIITNQSGFYRYKINDIVRVIGFYNQCPIITFAYRKGLMLNIAGEKMTEEHIKKSIKQFGQELNCEFDDFAVYADKQSDVPRYVVLVESPRQKLSIKNNEYYAKMLNRIFSNVNPEYDILTKNGSIGSPLVLIQHPYTHELWRKTNKTASSNQLKPVRVLNTLEKQKFFFSMLEKGQDLSTLPIIKEFASIK